MSKETDDLAPKKGETADQFKARIAETQRDIKRSEAQKPPEPPTVPPAPVPAQVPSKESQAVKPPAEPPKPATVTGNAEVDEWWAKKGFKSTEDLAQSYRELEREMHRKAQEARTTQPPQTPPVAPPAQGYPAYYPPQMPWVQPQPLPPAPQPQINVERLAQQYGLDPNDFERVAAVANDLAQSTIRQELARVMPPLLNQVQSVNREVGRQKELVDLIGDPAFKNPQVQFEMDRVFQSEPDLFANQTQPIRYAYEKALMRIARSNLGGSTGFPATPNPMVTPPSSTPPSTAGGNGSSGGGSPSGNTPEEITPDVFAKMKLEDQKAYLEAIGARK